MSAGAPPPAGPELPRAVWEGEWGCPEPWPLHGSWAAALSINAKEDRLVDPAATGSCNESWDRDGPLVGWRPARNLAGRPGFDQYPRPTCIALS